MNILYIHTHDTGRLISPYGYKAPTPNYQSLCEDSVLFQQAFSTAPTCSPSRAGLLTGIYPHQNGMLGLAQRGFHLDYEKHLANVLRKNNFHTVLCGVQHEIGYYTDHEMAIGKLGYQEDLSVDNHSYSEKELVDWDKENANQLVQWLNECCLDKPFFVSFGMHSTHRAFPDEVSENIDAECTQPPFDLVNNSTSREDYAKFQTSLEMADENIGLIVKALKDNQLYENTIILLTTDHGAAYPFAKCTLNDSGTGVLMAIRVPGSHFSGKTYDGLISQIDVMPTLLDLVGIDKPEYLEGCSFAPIFEGKTVELNEAVFSEINFHTSYEPVRAVRTERYKYIKFFDTEYHKINQSNIDDSEIKDFYRSHELEEQTKAEECLYDLYYDKYEKNNLASDSSYQEILQNMRVRLQQFMIKTEDPLLNGPIKIKPEWKVNKRSAISASSKKPEDYDSLGK